MFDRKKAKKAAKINVKSDYVMFVIACLFAAYLGVAYTPTLTAVQFNGVSEVIEDVSTRLTDTKTISADSVINRIISGQVEAGELISDKLMIENTNSGFKVGVVEFGRQKGVLSSVINQLDSGKFFVMLFQTMMSVTKSKSISVDIFIVLVALSVFVFNILIRDTYKVAFRRIFLEGHSYDHVKISRFLFLFRIKKFFKACWTIVLTDAYNFIWDFTIIGGIIKRYSYYMVPYIVAENPDINARSAIELSRRMMYGHKFECFKLELSFIGWHLFGIITLGLSRILFSNPYEECTYCSYYVYLRDLAKKNGISFAEEMNDKYLFEKADNLLIKETYADVVEIMNDDIDIKDIRHNGFRGFIENNFGIVYRNDSDEKLFNIAIEQEQKISEYISILKLEQYPGRLFTIPAEKKDPRLEHVHYLRRYSIWTIVSMFFIFGFIGWSWEVSLHLIQDGVFVNRGTLFGPWLPIYGFGGIMILLFLYRFRNRPGLEAFLAIVLCGFVEYYTHLFLEITKGTKWWDYSGYYLNINGRICAEGLLIFMLGGMAVVYVLAPIIDDNLKKINTKYLKIVCSVLLILFSIDFIYSSKHPNVGKGITDYGNAEKIENISIC